MCSKEEELDTLQLHLQEDDTLREAKQYLESIGITDEKYIKVYLSAELLYKFPDFYTNMTSELKEVVELVYKKQNLPDSILELNTQLIQYKNNDVLNVTEEINNMKIRTRSSSSETSDVNCVSCYENQENILNVAYTFFEKRKQN